MVQERLVSLLNALLQEQAETEWLEFKLNYHSAEEIGERISALANGACLNDKSYGYLVFGIEDKTYDVKGTTFNPKTQKAKGNEELELWLMNRLNPHVDLRIHSFYFDHKPIVMFEIPSAQTQPISFLHKPYIRVGSYTKELQHYPEKAAKIWKNNLADWSAQICPEATIDDLSIDAIKTARAQFALKNIRVSDESKQWDDITFLNKAKLTINGKITNTALLLLGLPESEHFINPASSRITWILKDAQNFEKDYQHFTMPLILSVSQVYQKIRNLKYRYIREDGLFPDEVDQYDPYIIREALHNCIAHQDYRLNGNIVVVETENDALTFTNLGEFIPQTVQHVIDADAPWQKYRNRFLIDAMVNLNMIDTIGSGIKKIFKIQKDRYFPLPDYDFSHGQVKLTIIGKILDLRYARKLALHPSLSLHDIMLLDRLQKKQSLTDKEVTYLRKANLVEGRKPNLYISADIAQKAGLKKDYMEMRGLDNQYYQTLVLEYLKKFGQVKRRDIEAYILDKLPRVLDEEQKKNRIKNLLQFLRKQGVIVVDGKLWMLK